MSHARVIRLIDSGGSPAPAPARPRLRRRNCRRWNLRPLLGLRACLARSKGHRTRGGTRGLRCIGAKRWHLVPGPGFGLAHPWGAGSQRRDMGVRSVALTMWRTGARPRGPRRRTDSSFDVSRGAGPSRGTSIAVGRPVAVRRSALQQRRAGGAHGSESPWGHRVQRARCRSEAAHAIASGARASSRRHGPREHARRGCIGVLERRARHSSRPPRSRP